MIDVVWKSYHKETPSNGYWDQGLLSQMLSGTLWSPSFKQEFHHSKDFPEGIKGAIVVIPARYHAKDIKKINKDLAKLQWVLLIVAGDEEGVFPVEEIKHPNIKIWLMTPHDKLYTNVDRFIGEGYPPDIRMHLAQSDNQDLANERPLDWSFSGQRTHSRRIECLDQLARLEPRYGDKCYLNQTDGFTKGLDHGEYYKKMMSSKVIPCPSGPETPDTFRFYEALEAGCIPIADAYSPKDKDNHDYWHMLFGADTLPFPIIKDYSTLPAIVENMRDRYKEVGNKTFSWWQNYKRELTYWLAEDLSILTQRYNLDKLITVLVPTSPIPSHPSTEIIEQTIKSIREQLPTAEILIMVDGLRPEQEDRKADYEEYTRRLLWKANTEWSNVLPLVFETHKHQSGMTKEVLAKVKTPMILFVEHDTPLCESIPWEQFQDIILTGEAQVIRLLHEAYILDPYKHMMLDDVAIDVMGVPMVRTAQWSQRPHLAYREYYRQILDNHFSDKYGMIEDVMHGIVHEAYANRGKVGWNDHRIMIYAPDGGDMKRTIHTDGRDGDSKYDTIIEKGTI